MQPLRLRGRGWPRGQGSRPGTQATSVGRSRLEPRGGARDNAACVSSFRHVTIVNEGVTVFFTSTLVDDARLLQSEAGL